MQPFESINQLMLPPQVKLRLQELMQRRSEGKLNASEWQELDLLNEVQETLAAVRAKAGTLRETAPPAPDSAVRTIRNGLPVVVVPPGTPAIDPAAVRSFLAEEVF